MLITNIEIFKLGEGDPLTETLNHRAKRSYEQNPAIYLDGIGQPWGILNEYKARNEIAAGFETIFHPMIGVVKNIEWINYIYYNQQRFINYTEDVLKALGEQLTATSQMTMRNRQTLDWLMAKEGGVCVLFGDKCCIYIPNNTAPGDSFYVAMERMNGLRKEAYKNAGFNVYSMDWFTRFFRQWG